MVNKNKNKKNQPPTGEGKKQSPRSGEANKPNKRSEVLQAQRGHAEENIGANAEERPADDSPSRSNPQRTKAGR